VKFDMGDFSENLSIKSIFIYNRVKISGSLHEDVSFTVLGNIKSATNTLWCNTQYFDTAEGNK
jgi:hypothetical protein